MKKSAVIYIVLIIASFWLGRLSAPAVKPVEDLAEIHRSRLQVAPTMVPVVKPVEDLADTPEPDKTEIRETATKPADNNDVVIINRAEFKILNRENKLETIVIPELSLPCSNLKIGEISYEDYTKVASGLLFNTNARDFLADKFVLDHLNLKPDMTVAEIGIGSGPYTLAIADKVKAYYGQDLGESSLRFVRWRMELSKNGFFEQTARIGGADKEKIVKKEYKNIHLFAGDVDDAKIPVECDLIFMHQVHAFKYKLLYSQYEKKFAKSLVSRLKKNGELIIVEGIVRNEDDRSAEEIVAFLEQFSLKKSSIIKTDNNLYILKMKKI